MRIFVERHPFTSLAFAACALAIAAAALFTQPRVALSQGATVPITGYLWSDTIGWIDLNCSNSGVCASNPFGFSVNGTGVLSGYAWSDNIGWVSANSADLSGCPSAPCSAQITGSTLTGWLKATAADNNDWDGWISLNGSNYGVTLGTGSFAGYAWGDENVGWVSWANAATTFNSCTAAYSCSGNTIIYTNSSCQVSTSTTCAAPSFCSPGSSVCLYPQPQVVGDLTIVPALVTNGATAKVTWNIQSVTSCTVTGSNGDSWSGLSGSQTTKPITNEVTYTLSCVVEQPAQPPFTETATVGIVPKYEER